MTFLLRWQARLLHGPSCVGAGLLNLELGDSTAQESWQLRSWRCLDALLLCAKFGQQPE